MDRLLLLTSIEGIPFSGEWVMVWKFSNELVPYRWMLRIDPGSLSRSSVLRSLREAIDFHPDQKLPTFISSLSNICIRMIWKFNISLLSLSPLLKGAWERIEQADILLHSKLWGCSYCLSSRSSQRAFRDVERWCIIRTGLSCRSCRCEIAMQSRADENARVTKMRWDGIWYKSRWKSITNQKKVVKWKQNVAHRLPNVRLKKESHFLEKLPFCSCEPDGVSSTHLRFSFERPQWLWSCRSSDCPLGFAFRSPIRFTFLWHWCLHILLLPSKFHRHILLACFKTIFQSFLSDFL